MRRAVNIGPKRLNLGRRYNYLVRVKTSITLPAELLTRLELERQARDRRDVEIINRNAGRLNREAADILEYQKLP